MKTKNKTFNNRIFVQIVATIIFIYVSYATYLLVKQPTDTFRVDNGTLYLDETIEGYVIRKETVIKGENYKNGMEQIALEGEKVAKNESVFRYYSNNEDNLREKIADLDNKIQDSLEKDNSGILYSSDLKILEGQIDEKIKNLSKLTDINTIEDYKKQVSDLVTKKAKIAGELSPSGSYIKQLIQERGNLENQLNSGSEYVKAPISGVVSYRVDGLEETLGNIELSSLSKEYLENLNLKTGKMVAISTESGKVIDNFSCYIVTILNSEKSREAKVGDKVKVSLSGDKEIDANIAYIKPEENQNLVVLEVNELTEELINYRKLSFNLIWWSYSGLKVPNQAIKEKDGLQYVVRSRAGYLNKILVKVLRQNDKYSIVTAYSTDELKELGYTPEEISAFKKITIYDEIILNPNLDDTD